MNASRIPWWPSPLLTAVNWGSWRNMQDPRKSTPTLQISPVNLGNRNMLLGVWATQSCLFSCKEPTGDQEWQPELQPPHMTTGLPHVDGHHAFWCNIRVFWLPGFPSPPSSTYRARSKTSTNPAPSKKPGRFCSNSHTAVVSDLKEKGVLLGSKVALQKKSITWTPDSSELL